MCQNERFLGGFKETKKQTKISNFHSTLVRYQKNKKFVSDPFPLQKPVQQDIDADTR